MILKLVIAYILIVVLSFFAVMKYHRRYKKSDAIVYIVISIGLIVYSCVEFYSTWILKIAILGSISLILNYICLLGIIDMEVGWECDLKDWAPRKKEKIRDGIAFSILITACLMVLTFAVDAYIATSHRWNNNKKLNYETAEVVETKKLERIERKTKSNIYLLEGKENQKTVYRYYFKQSDGGIKQITKKADDCIIYETNKEPYIETVKVYYEDWNFKEPRLTDFSVTFYKIYIPDGSIATEN